MFSVGLFSYYLVCFTSSCLQPRRWWVWSVAIQTLQPPLHHLVWHYGRANEDCTDLWSPLRWMCPHTRSVIEFKGMVHPKIRTLHSKLLKLTSGKSRNIHTTMWKDLFQLHSLITHLVFFQIISRDPEDRDGHLSIKRRLRSRMEK